MACGPAPTVVAILVEPFSYQRIAPICKRATFWRLRALTFFTRPSSISCKRGPDGHASEKFPLRDVCPHTLGGNRDAAHVVARDLALVGNARCKVAHLLEGG